MSKSYGFYPVSVLKKLPLFSTQVTDELVALMGSNKTFFIKNNKHTKWAFKVWKDEQWITVFSLIMTVHEEPSGTMTPYVYLKTEHRVIGTLSIKPPTEIIVHSDDNQQLILRSQGVATMDQWMAKLNLYIVAIEPEHYMCQNSKFGFVSEYGPHITISAGVLFYLVSRKLIEIDEAIELQKANAPLTIRYRGTTTIALTSSLCDDVYFLKLNTDEQAAVKSYI